MDMDPKNCKCLGLIVLSQIGKSLGTISFSIFEVIPSKLSNI